MLKMFEDRRTEFFGRERDVHHLTDRARHRGLTAVVARPLMGKTWTLEEVARRLTEEGRYLVGYHESTATENSHMLYAISNLYARWLTDSTMLGQATSLWVQYKNDLVPSLGKMVGNLFKKLDTKQLPVGVADIVSATFNGLADAQKDLMSGGVQLPVLSYDQALSLTNLVAKLSGRHIVLILDAWEKAPSIRSDHAILESFLKHQNDWPHTHIVLAIRNPEFDSTKVSDEGYMRAQDLRKLSPDATVYDLPSITLDDSMERERVVSYLHRNVCATEGVSDLELHQMIGGFPGVLDFWKKETDRTGMLVKEDLRRLASDAQSLRYLEFNQLLKELSTEQRTFAARLAFFQRLDAEKWIALKSILLKDLRDAVFDELVDHKVLNDDAFPSYGHDTRHAAARQWFIENSLPFIRRVSESLVESTASLIVGKDSTSLRAVGVLSACLESARQVDANQTTCCLIDAARAIFGGNDGSSHQRFDEAYPRALLQNASFAPLIAMSLFIRGDRKGQRSDFEGAIADYSNVIGVPNAPAELVAWAFNARGMAKDQRGNVEGAIADFTFAVGLLNVPVEQVAGALYNRGIAKSKRGDSDGALTDFNAVTGLPNAPVEVVALALYSRGAIKGECADPGGAIADYNAVIELPNAPVKQVVKALYNRGIAKGLRGDSDGEISDYNAMIGLPNVPTEAVALALYSRGAAKGERGDLDGAMADFTAVIGLPNAPVGQVAMALHNRIAIKIKRGDIDGVIAECTAMIELPNAPVEEVAKALYASGLVKSERGDIDGAIANLTAVSELPHAPAEVLEMAQRKLRSIIPTFGR